MIMCDMIPNAEHWRVPVWEAQELQHAIMGYLPGYATPRIVCDVPYVSKRWVHQFDRATDGDLATIDKAVERMDRAADEREMVRCDVDFHDAIYTAARHRRLLEAWEAIRSQVYLFLLTRIGLNTDGYLTCVPDERRKLAASLRAREREAALEQLAVHRRHALDVLVEHHRSRRDSARRAGETPEQPRSADRDFTGGQRSSSAASRTHPDCLGRAVVPRTTSSGVSTISCGLASGSSIRSIAMRTEARA
jgi:hypothetical protein